MILKVYFIITWCLGIIVYIEGWKQWKEENSKYDMFNPHTVLPLIAIFMPIIFPILIVYSLYDFIYKKNNDN